LKLGAHRVIFIDLARAIGVIFMIQGHTFDALLDGRFRTGPIFAIWVFQRGLTSCLFLLLSGFVFSVATARHWNSHTRLSLVALSRVRRFTLFVLLGYGLHFPVSRFAELSGLSDERWRAFLAVDVLQLIGVSLIALQLLVLLLRTPRAFAIAVFAACALVVVATPRAWTIDWSAHVPLSLAAYLSSATGSLFPLIPWSAYVLLGAGLGQIYSHWGAANLNLFATGILVRGGAGAIVCAFVLSQLPYQPFGAADFWSTSPNQFLLRAGTVLLVLGLVAHLSRRLAYLPRGFAALAQESLPVYFTHLCIVYGSIWNLGLQGYLGAVLSPGSVALVVLVLVSSMIVLAWAWNWCKHVHGRVARLTAFAVFAYLIWALL
jgi:uncharacterized membrane protein